MVFGCFFVNTQTRNPKSPKCLGSKAMAEASKVGVQSAVNKVPQCSPVLGISELGVWGSELS